MDWWIADGWMSGLMIGSRKAEAQCSAAGDDRRGQEWAGVSAEELDGKR